MRADFTIKPHPLGERLVWRNPAADAAIERRLLAALAPHGQTSIPRTVTIGYYLASAGDHTPPAFRPALTPAALAALSLTTVQERIAGDLATRAAPLLQSVS
jgi:hypothetical protein